MLICGVDEAGRGPCIGPLVICGAMIKEEDIPKLIALKVKDSKLLSSKQREFLFGKLKKIVKYKAVTVFPEEIDRAVNKHDGLNLNWLEARKTAEIINALKPDKAVLDCPSPNITAYTDYLIEYVKNKEIELLAEHKADLKYVIVGAASIIAKVIRDREIMLIQEKINEPIGSGYPADPLTKEFLKKNYNKYPDIFRKSWASFKAVAEQKKQKKLTHFK